MVLPRRVQPCDPPRRHTARRDRSGHARRGRAWRRLLQDGRVYVIEAASAGTLVTVLRGGEDAVRRVLLGADARVLASFLLEDATGRPAPPERVAALVSGVLEPRPGGRLVVTSLDLCCWSVVHAVLHEN